MRIVVGGHDAGASEPVRSALAAHELLAWAGAGHPVPDRGAELVIVCARRYSTALAELVSQAGRALDGPAGRVVVVCDRIGSADARRLLAAGASGLVVGDRVATALLPTIEAVRAGQVCLPRRRAADAERPVLSPREKQVIGLVALGLANAEIAERLYLAESTVKSHLNSAFAKLGVGSRHEAIALIIDPAFGLDNGIMSLGAAPVVGSRQAE